VIGEPDALHADPPVAWVFGRIVGFGGEGMQHAARAELLHEGVKPAFVIVVGEFLVSRIFGLLLRVQVVEVAEEFIEPVGSRQMLVAVARPCLRRRLV
jgi:hypothetical protein